MSLVSRVRDLVRRLFFAGAPTPPEAGIETPVTPAPQAAPLPDFNAIGHLFQRRQVDAETLAGEATTDFERAYYAHLGDTMFKWAHYLPVYDRLLKPYVGKPVTLVEIGLAGGGSLELWRRYLGPQIRILGVELQAGAVQYIQPGVEILIGDQGDRDFMRRVAETVGEADIVIDDGSHVCAHQILAFETLFPIVKPGGVFICEDLHTSYWPDYGGGLGREDSFVAYAKRLIDRLHFKYGLGELAADDPARQVGVVTVVDSLMAFEKAAEKPVFMAWVGKDRGLS